MSDMKSTCGVCRREINGLFRDHTFESCSIAVQLDRDKAESALAASQARAERYREALERIIEVNDHGHWCSENQDNRRFCDCHLAQAKAALRAEKEGGM